MILESLTLLNYRNIEEARLGMSPKFNCLIGHNGAGKTNVLDAIHYLSFCKSATNPADSQVMRHEADFFMLEGRYISDDGQDEEHITASMKRGTKKRMKRNKKEYKRLSEHIGLIPIVSVSPADSWIIGGGSEERRRLMDMVISQYDRTYIEALNRYDKALQQRNAMLKAEEEPNPELMEILEEQMAESGERIFEARNAFVEQLVPVFQQYYSAISGDKESVSMHYISHCQRGPLLDVIRRNRLKDRAVGYSLHGIHRDDIEFLIGNHLIKREGSQGQNKTFVIALKLSQFEFLKRTSPRNAPILLLDDIFDKLDADRVEQIVRIVASDNFGQIFITDTNRDHLDEILRRGNFDFRLFNVENGNII